MIRSMTGYGASEGQWDGYSLHVEIRSVNHRFCELSIRMPREWLLWEDAVKRAVQSHVKRGRVDITVSIERMGAAGRTVVVDWMLVDAYREAAEQIRERLGLPESEKLLLADVLRLPDLLVLSEQRGEMTPTELETELLKVVHAASLRFVAARETEGAHLLRDIAERLGAIEQMHKTVQALAPFVVGDYRTRLTQRLKELLGDPNGSGLPDENRLAMEVALLADRADIQEELTRLESHLLQCKDLLQGDEPIGRKLDFFIQEMNREVNTIGSKANRVDIVSRVVDMKAELEKMREQVQNIE